MIFDQLEHKEFATPEGSISYWVTPRFPKLKTLQQSHADFCSTEGAIQLLFFAEESPEPFQFPCSACSPRHSKDMESCTAPYHSL